MQCMHKYAIRLSHLILVTSFYRSYDHIKTSFVAYFIEYEELIEYNTWFYFSSFIFVISELR